MSGGVRDPVGQGAAEDEGCGVGVGEEFGEFLAGVAVVGVHRHGTELEGGEDRLQVGGAVVQVTGHGVARPYPGHVQRGGQPGRALVELPVRGLTTGFRNGDGIGKRAGDRFPDRADGHVHTFRTSSSSVARTDRVAGHVSCATPWIRRGGPVDPRGALLNVGRSRPRGNASNDATGSAFRPGGEQVE